MISEEALIALSSLSEEAKNEFILRVSAHAVFGGLGGHATASPSFVQGTPGQVPQAVPFAHPWLNPYATPNATPHMVAAPYLVPHGMQIPGAVPTNAVPDATPFAHPYMVPGAIPQNAIPYATPIGMQIPDNVPTIGKTPMLIPSLKAKHIDAYLNTGDTDSLKAELDKIDAQNKKYEGEKSEAAKAELDKIDAQNKKYEGDTDNGAKAELDKIDAKNLKDSLKKS